MILWASHLTFPGPQFSDLEIGFIPPQIIGAGGSYEVNVYKLLKTNLTHSAIIAVSCTSNAYLKLILKRYILFS